MELIRKTSEIIGNPVSQTSGNNPEVNVNYEKLHEENERKKIFSEAINHCLDLLQQNNYLTFSNSETISRKSAIVGQEMYELMKKIRMQLIVPKIDDHEWLSSNGTSKKAEVNSDISYENSISNFPDESSKSVEMTFVKKEPPDYIQENEHLEEQISDYESSMDSSHSKYSHDSSIISPHSISNFVEVKEDDKDILTTNNNSFDETSMSSNCQGTRRKYEYIPYEEKLKTVNMARENPQWEVKVLRERSGCQQLNSYSQIREWAKQLKKGGSRQDKRNKINNHVFAKCIESKERKEKVTNDMLTNWGLEAQRMIAPRSLKFREFHASVGWLRNFKKCYSITGSHRDLQFN